MRGWCTTQGAGGCSGVLPRVGHRAPVVGCAGATRMPAVPVCWLAYREGGQLAGVASAIQPVRALDHAYAVTLHGTRGANPSCACPAPPALCPPAHTRTLWEDQRKRLPPVTLPCKQPVPQLVVDAPAFVVVGAGGGAPGRDH